MKSASRLMRAAPMLVVCHLCLALVAVVDCVPARADDRTRPAAGFTPRSDFAAKATEYMQARVRVSRFSGAVLVAHGGQPIFREGYGAASYELDVPSTPKTKFHVGSV